MANHNKSCPAYGNYQPPYEECNCGADEVGERPRPASQDSAFYDSFDAVEWAKAFVAIVKEKPEIATDEGTMVSWFANAIMRGYDEWPRRQSPVRPPGTSEGQRRHVAKLCAAFLRSRIATGEKQQ